MSPEMRMRTERPAARNPDNVGTPSLEEKFKALKFMLAGQALHLAVLKSTSSELMGPKRKHLNYLVRLTNEPNVSIGSLVQQLMRRRHSTPDWRVTFKVLISCHHLASYGNERFIHTLASSAEHKRQLERLAHFNDCNSRAGFAMSPFVRRYARYLRVKTETYFALGTDFCQPDGQSASRSRMSRVGADKLLLLLARLQEQLDALHAFDPVERDLSNGIISAAFALLYRDFVKLYMAYQAAINRLLELYFGLSQVRRTRQLLDAYRKFLVRMDKTCDLIRVLDAVGMDRSDLPAFSRVPGVPLRQLEAHLSALQEAAARRASCQASGQIQSVEMPRIEYATLGRRRSTSRALDRSSSLAESLLSPLAVRNRRGLEPPLAEEPAGDQRPRDSPPSPLAAANCDNFQEEGEAARLSAALDAKPEATLLLLDFAEPAEATRLQPTAAEADDRDLLLW